jgi:hypothetical protein
VSDYRAPVWPYPITVIGILLATACFVIWPSAATTSVSATSAQNMSVLDRERLECDRQVAILMGTKDPVELERAQFLIKWFDCAVGRRLPPP